MVLNLKYHVPVWSRSSIESRSRLTRLMCSIYASTVTLTKTLHFNVLSHSHLSPPPFAISYSLCAFQCQARALALYSTSISSTVSRSYGSRSLFISASTSTSASHIYKTPKNPIKGAKTAPTLLTAPYHNVIPSVFGIRPLLNAPTPSFPYSPNHITGSAYAPPPLSGNITILTQISPHNLLNDICGFMSRTHFNMISEN